MSSTKGESRMSRSISWKGAQPLTADKTARAVEKLDFVKGVLTLLRDTRLFGPMMDDALSDLEEVLAWIKERAP